MATVRVDGVDFRMSERSLELVCEGAQLHTCRGCGSSDVTDPFAMDGYADGEYQAKGLFWIVCRGCGRTTRVETTYYGFSSKAAYDAVQRDKAASPWIQGREEA